MAAALRVIDAAVGETFETASRGLDPRVSALSAEAAYERAAGAPLTDTVSTEVGYLTLGAGAGAPGVQVYSRTPAFAFSQTACEPQIGPAPAPGGVALDASTTESTSAVPPECTQWMFVDAVTGEVLDMTWTH